MSVLADRRSLIAGVWSDPDVGLRRLSYRYFFDGVDPGHLRILVSDWLDGLADRWQEPSPPPTTPADQFRAALFSRSPTDRWHWSRWNPATRGAPRVLNTDTAALYADYLKEKASPQGIAEDLERMIHSDDLLDLHFSPSLVDDYIGMCRAAQQHAER